MHVALCSEYKLELNFEKILGTKESKNIILYTLFCASFLFFHAFFA